MCASPIKKNRKKDKYMTSNGLSIADSRDHKYECFAEIK